MQATGAAWCHTHCPQIIAGTRENGRLRERKCSRMHSFTDKALDQHCMIFRRRQKGASVHKVGPTRAATSAKDVSASAGTIKEDTNEIDRSSVSKADVVVIGAGIGGLCCAALLANYGFKVVVCESHDTAGGAGHAFERQGFQFDSGPSFHAGLSIKPSINPLKQVCLCF